MILRNFISRQSFTVYMENSLRFEISLLSICTEVSFTTPEVIWTLIMKLPHTEVKFYPEVKSQTGLSSLWVSCKRALRKKHCFRLIKNYYVSMCIRMLRNNFWKGFEISRLVVVKLPCKRNDFSRRLEIPNWFEFTSGLM